MESIVGKPGVLTSEFWLSVVALLSSVLIAWKGEDFGLAANAQAIATFAPVVLSGVYTAIRGKLKAQTHAAIAANNSTIVGTDSGYAVKEVIK